MDENRLTGTARNLSGKVEEGLGRIAGDAQTQFEGRAKQVAGAAEDLYGQAKDAAASFTDIVQRTIEQQPYTAVRLRLRSAGYSAGRIGPFNDGDALRIYGTPLASPHIACVLRSQEKWDAHHHPNVSGGGALLLSPPGPPGNSLVIMDGNGSTT
jgi:uncharacterized protein YjbJ (UPF0337 family)